VVAGAGGAAAAFQAVLTASTAADSTGRTDGLPVPALALAPLPVEAPLASALAPAPKAVSSSWVVLVNVRVLAMVVLSAVPNSKSAERIVAAEPLPEVVVVVEIGESGNSSKW